MSIDVYYFTHYFNDEAYHFKVYDTGNSRVVECNGTDILPLSNDKFGFCDNQGNQHILSFSFGFGNRRCFIDNVKYNYLGETNWYDSIFVLIPLISMIFIGRVFSSHCSTVTSLGQLKTPCFALLCALPLPSFQ